MNILYYFAQLIDPSPLPNVNGNPQTLNTIFKTIYIIIGALTVLLFIWGGFRYMISQGDPQKVAIAKTRFLHITIGLVIATSAVTIVNFIVSRFG
jgi:hypothetical protein